MRWAAVALLSLAVVAAAPPVRGAAPAPGGDRAAPDADLRAKELFGAQRYAEALEIYTGLYARSHHPTYLRNLGRCHQMMRQPEPAIGYFQAYLRDARDLSAAERAEIEGYIAEMQRLRATTAPPLAPSPSAASSSVTLAPAEPRGAGPTPVTQKWWFWTALGAVVVGAAVTAIALSAGSSKRLSCPPETICP